MQHCKTGRAAACHRATGSHASRAPATRAPARGWSNTRAPPPSAAARLGSPPYPRGRPRRPCSLRAGMPSPPTHHHRLPADLLLDHAALADLLASDDSDGAPEHGASGALDSSDSHHGPAPPSVHPKTSTVFTSGPSSSSSSSNRTHSKRLMPTSPARPPGKLHSKTPKTRHEDHPSRPMTCYSSPQKQTQTRTSLLLDPRTEVSMHFPWLTSALVLQCGKVL